jgi:Na+/H+-dicarboxylate symporter
VAATRLGAAQRRSLTLFFEAVAGAMLVVIGWILWCGPVGVFALSLALAARSGTAAIGALAHYVMIVALTGSVVLLAAYPLAVLGGRLRPGLLPARSCPHRLWRFRRNPRSPRCPRC